MAYTLAELQTDIRGYTEVDSNVFTDAVGDAVVSGLTPPLTAASRGSLSSSII